MKPFLFAVAFGGLASVAVADPLDTLVPEYEAYVDANSPEGAARRPMRREPCWKKCKKLKLSAR